MLLHWVRLRCHDDEDMSRKYASHTSMSQSSVACSCSELRFSGLLFLAQVVAKELPQTPGLGDWHRNSEPCIAIGGGPCVGSAAELKTKTAARVSCYNGLPLGRNRNVAHSRSVRRVCLSLRLHASATNSEFVI